MIKNTDREVIELIQAQVRAELETAAELRRQNDLAEKSLTALNREANAAAQRRNLAFDTNEKVSGLLPGLQKAFRDIKQINRRLDQAERRAEQRDDLLLLLLTERRPEKVIEVAEDLEAEIAERKKHQKILLRQRRRNLNKLHEQAASYGIRVPLELANEIETEEEAILALERSIENRSNRR